MTNEELMRGYVLTGDQALFTDLADNLTPFLQRCISRWVRCPEDAEDVLQSTLLQLFRYKDRYNGRRVEAWAYVIARNATVDLYRRHRCTKHRRILNLHDHDVQQVDPIDDLEECIGDATTIDRLQRAINGLSNVHKTVLQQIFGTGLKYREAATALDLPEGTVKSRVHHAIVALKVAMGAT